MKQKGSLIVLIGPSGSGKGTVLGEFFKTAQNTFLSVSATTRQPRPGDVEGKNYYFKTKEQFQELIDHDGLLEWASYCDNFYGTPKAAVCEKLDAGQNVILEIEIQGAQLIKKKFPQAVLVFILPPSLSELKRRLEGRQTEPAEVIQKRLSTAIGEIEFAQQCDYVIVNDIAESAAKNLEAVIKAAGFRESNMEQTIQTILNNK